MKKKRFSVGQIVAVVKQTELGVPVAEVIRKVGISEQTFSGDGKIGCEAKIPATSRSHSRQVH